MEIGRFSIPRAIPIFNEDEFETKIDSSFRRFYRAERRSFTSSITSARSSTVSTSRSSFVTIIYLSLRSSPNLAVSIHPRARFSVCSSVHFFCPIFSTVATRSPAERMHDKKGRFARIHIRRESHSRET